MKSAINLCLSASSRLGGSASRHFSSSPVVNQKVGFIGLGNMGQHMAGYVQKGGHQLYVYDTNPEAVRPLVLQNDAVVATSPADLASKVDRLITMVPTPKDVLEVYLGKDGIISGGQAKKGTILVDSSTIDPTTAKTVAKEAAKHNLSFVDAPVTGAVIGARAGTLTFLVGGPEETVLAVKELLMTMGKNVIHCGPVGTGQVAKICNNMLLSVVLVGTSETLNLGERLGLDPKLLTQILNISSGRSWVTESYNPVSGVGDPSLPASNNYTGGFGCKLMAKDLTLAQTIAVESQSPIPMGSLAAQVYRLMTNNGFGEKDMSYAYQFFKQKDQV